MIMDCWGGAKIRCEFSQTQINTDNIVLKTIFHNVPDSTLYVKPETIRKENTLIQGKNGEELVLTKKGQVMGKNEFNATGGNSVLLKEYHRKSDSLAQWQINFSKYDAQTYAFDHIGSGNHGIFSGADYYPQSGSYDFRYKSVECGKNDKVKVEFDTYPEKDSVVFKDKYGVTYPVSLKDNVLSFTGVSKADTNFIYAYRGDQKIGKLFLNTYQKKTYKVVLISVNGAKLPNVKDLENYLNKVYRQCADSFKIETRKLQVSGIENFTHGGTKVAGSVWNASQKAVLEAFGEKYEDNTAYLFFIPKAETGGVAGYMPRYYPYGFIYPGAANRTIAHELGHGIAGLEHPFPESQVSGNTQNLMDYRDGEELWHFQWDMLQDPARKIFKWWQNEEGSEAYKNNSNWICIKSEIIDKIKQISKYFYLPNGKIANYSVYDPSGFYTSADGDAPKSYGAVATIRYKDYDFALTYNTLDKEKHIYKNAGYGQKVKNTQGEVVTNTTFPIQDSDFDGKYEPVKVLIDGQKISVYKYLTQEEGTLVAEFDNAVCNCRPADYQTIEVDTKLEQLLEKRSNGESQYWFYDVKNNKIVVILNYTGGRVLGKNSGGTIDLDELKQKNAEIVDFESMAAFANSDYNWLANEVRSTMNEAGKYVIAGLTITAAAPFLLDAALIEEGASSLTNFTFSATSDLFFSLFIEYLTSEKDNWMDNVNWTDLFADAGLSGVQAIVPVKKGKKIVDAGIDCLSSITITDLSNIGDNIGKITVECGIGIILGWALSTKQAQKIQQWLWNLGPGKLSQIIKKKLPFVKTPADEVRVVEALKNTTEKKLPDGWSDEMVEILDTDGGKQAYEFLIKCNYDITVNNFQQLSLIYSKIGDSEQKKLETLLTQGYNADNLITSITERQSSGNVSETVNTVADELLNKTSKEQSQMVLNKVENNSTNVSTLDGHQPTSNSNLDKSQTPQHSTKDNAETNKKKAIAEESAKTTPKIINDLPEDLRRQYKEEDLQKFIDKPEMFEAWNELNKYRTDYPADYAMIFDNALEINTLEIGVQKGNYADQVLNVIKMGDRGMDDWLGNENICSKFFSDPAYWDTWRLLQDWKTKNPGSVFPDDVFKDFGKFEKVVHNQDLPNTWKMIPKTTKIPANIINDVDFIEKLNKCGPELNLKNIERTFCDDNMSDYLCKQIKENDYSLAEIQALCGDFEHCVKEDGSNLLELYDFIKGGKKNALDNKAFDYYNSEVKTLRQKAIDYFVEKTPDFVNAFAQEFVANIVVNIVKHCTDNYKNGYYTNQTPTFIKNDIESYVSNDLMMSFALYESCLRNAFNTLGSSYSEGKWSFLGLSIDVVSGINYTNLLNPQKPIGERINRAFFGALFNIMKNVILKHRDQWLNKKIPYVNTIGEQVFFDGLEIYLEDYYIELINGL